MINCGHYAIPFIPGFSKPRQPEQTEEQNAKEYQESQQQRALERKYREEKRDLNVLKAQGAPEEELRAQRQRVADARNNLDQFCAETGRARRSSMERTPTDATWQTKNGTVRRFNGNYVSTDQPFHVQTDQPVQPMQPVKPAPQPQAPQQPQITEELVTTVLPNSGIQPKDLTKWSSTPTDEQIISSLGGGDKTKGSCSSLAFAYAGNEAGYDVRDFRGGQSCSFFSMTNNIEKVANFDGVESLIVRNTNEIKACHELFDQMQENKKYYLFTGRHSAVIRKTEGKLKYLELQSHRNNGWFDLNDTILRNRFRAHKSNTSYGMLLKPRSGIIDIESLIQSPDFIEMLKYINTAVGDQMKGATGGIK